MLSEWEWKNCRQLGFEFGFWPLAWEWPNVSADADQFGGAWRLNIGPFAFTMHANAGKAFCDRASENEHE